MYVVTGTGTNDENDRNDDLTNMASSQIDGIPRDVVISLESFQEKLKGNINYTSWNIYIRNTEGFSRRLHRLLDTPSDPDGLTIYLII
jgi:hypothetical protein